MGRIASDRGVDAPPGLDHTPHQGDVFLLDLAIVKLPRQLLMGTIVLGDDHHTRRAAIQPVHDARPQLAADAAEIGEVVEQCVHERARAMTRARMNHHACRLVQHGEIRVLVEDVERQCFSRHRRRRRLRCINDDLVALVDLQVGPRVQRARRQPPDGHVTVGDQLLDLRSGVIR